MENNLTKTEESEVRDLVMAMGGLALVVFGTGLILSHPSLRRYLGIAGLSGIAAAAIPDLKRYLHIRAM